MRPCYLSRMNQKQYSARLAKALAALCVRHTVLEDIHAGKPVVSRTGDYRDVKLVTPSGEIPWNEVSRITQAEMKTLMKQVVNKLYTVLMSLEDEEAMYLLFSHGQDYTYNWDEPEFLPTFLKAFIPPEEDSAIAQPPASGPRNE